MTKELDERKIWIDGCFDFVHHGHAGAMRQARQLGDELFVGIHTDEDIAFNKGPVVMSLEERVKAVDACRWTTASVPGAPYVTMPEVMDEYHCKYVVHGDDITTDADGNDCYRIVKDMGRFVVVKRTPNISTTDLVGRMLSSNKSHHMQGNIFDHDSERFAQYATGPDGHKAWCGVYGWDQSSSTIVEHVAPGDQVAARLSKNIYYVDGAFDLFFSGHIEFLRLVKERAAELGHSDAAVVVGIQSDAEVNEDEGVNYPVMNQFERALCVLQCQYVDGIVLNAPRQITEEYLSQIGDKVGKVTKVLHGPTSTIERYDLCKQLGIFEKIGDHKYSSMSTRTIMDRVLSCQEQYEERQRKKGWKRENESRLEAEEKKSASN